MTTQSSIERLRRVLDHRYPAYLHALRSLAQLNTDYVPQWADNPETAQRVPRQGGQIVLSPYQPRLTQFHPIVAFMFALATYARATGQDRHVLQVLEVKTGPHDAYMWSPDVRFFLHVNDLDECVDSDRFRTYAPEFVDSCISYARAYTCGCCENECVSHDAEIRFVCGVSDPYCPACIEQNAGECDECAEWYVASDLTYARSDREVCDSCLSSHYHFNDDLDVWERDDERSLEGVYAYSTNVMNHLPAHLKKAGEHVQVNSLLLGVELEVEPRRSAPGNLSSQVAELVAPFAILKSDSSIGEGGFEIVTAPSTIRAQRENWKPFFKKNGLTQHLRSYGTGRCGIHVHMTRAAFVGKAHLARFERFINCASNLAFVQTIAGRTSSQWAQTYPDKAIKHSLKGSYAQGRYSAVNLQTRNHKTVEVRIFRGNVDPVGFLKNLDFCVALFEFTRDCGLTDSDLSARAFLSWLFQAENQSRFRTLVYWLTRRSLWFQRKHPDLHARAHVPMWPIERMESIERAAA